MTIAGKNLVCRGWSCSRSILFGVVTWLFASLSFANPPVQDTPWVPVFEGQPAAFDSFIAVTPSASDLPMSVVQESTIEGDSDRRQLEERIAIVEEQLRAWRSAEDMRLEAAAKMEPAPTKPNNPLDYFHEPWKVTLGGHVQLDYVNWAKASPSIPNAEDYFEFRRLRLLASGTGHGNCDFRLQMTLEPETIGETQPLGLVASPDVKDAYFSMNELPWLGRFRIGNFFVPFSLEQVTNDTNNIFLERSIPTQGVFSPDREVGMAFYNATPDEYITWTYGVFFDSISEGLKERIDDNQGYRVCGRMTCLPYYDELSDGRYLLHLGAGILHTGDQDDRVRIRARPQIHEGPRIIDSGILDSDRFTTGNIELAWVHGAFTLQSEAFLSKIDRLTSDPSQVEGCYVHTSYFLTGENRKFEKFGQHGAQFGRNVPKMNFFRSHKFCGPGAWEWKTRWSYLDLSSVGAGQYNDWTIGWNWYWSDRTRIMFDWIHPITSRDARFGATDSDILATRFDFNW